MEILNHIMDTIFGVYHYKFSKEWDTALNLIMDKCDSVRLTPHCIDFTCDSDVITVWVSNKYYAYGYIREINGKVSPKYIRLRPRFKTMQRLNALHTKLMLEQEREQRALDEREFWAQLHNETLLEASRRNVSE